MSLLISQTGLDQYLDGGSGKIKILLAGAPSSGKTVFGSWANKPIFAACEDGLMSVAHRRLPFARITSEDDMNELLSRLEQECKKPEKNRAWDTLVIDTLDAYERTVIHHYTRKSNKTSMSGWEDWGYLSSVMNGLMGRLALLPMNIVVLVHTKDVTLEGQTPENQIVPRIKGEIRDQIVADFDFVGLIKVEWGVDDGKRVLKRSITWEPIPEAPWLKCRGGALTNTPINGNEQDFQLIRSGILALAQSLALQPTTVVETVQTSTPTPATPEELEGGPVEPKTRAKAAPQRPGPDLSPPPVAQPSLPVAEATEEEAIKNVETILGGTVIDPNTPADDAPDPVVAEDAATQGVEAAASPPAQHVPSTEPEAPQTSGKPDYLAVSDFSGKATVTCGDSRYGGEAKAPGCGEPMALTFSEGRVVDAGEGEVASLVEIGGIKFQTFLHNACFTDARKASVAAAAN